MMDLAVNIANISYGTSKVMGVTWNRRARISIPSVLLSVCVCVYLYNGAINMIV